jgi:hypothetical protein
MPPHGPTASDDRFAITRLEYLIERVNDAAITAGQVLRFKHARPPGKQGVGEFKLLR